MRNDVKTQNNFDKLIDSFRLIIRLRMINRENEYSCFKFMKYNLSKIRHEFVVFIRYNNVRNISIVFYKRYDDYVDSINCKSNIVIRNQ